MTDQEPADPVSEAVHLTLAISPDLYRRIAVAAAQNGLSLHSYLKRIIEEGVSQGASSAQRARRPVSREGIERLLRTREAVMQGRRFTDSSADLIREAREERMEQL